MPRAVLARRRQSRATGGIGAGAIALAGWRADADHESGDGLGLDRRGASARTGTEAGGPQGALGAQGRELRCA
ncbi:hypothetical protein GCM10020260_05050 [Nesterenkonia halobia]|uniref:Uncharacterized protein n=1 Tax=Nesterenkonia halobia TaxID=37922 RepID=A0ABP6R9P9_9MICC